MVAARLRSFVCFVAIKASFSVAFVFAKLLVVRTVTFNTWTFKVGILTEDPL